MPLSPGVLNPQQFGQPEQQQEPPPPPPPSPLHQIASKALEVLPDLLAE